MFFKWQKGKFTINVIHIVEIEEGEITVEGQKYRSWEVTMSTGSTYTIAGENLARLEAVLLRLSSWRMDN